MLSVKKYWFSEIPRLFMAIPVAVRNIYALLGYAVYVAEIVLSRVKYWQSS